MATIFIIDDHPVARVAVRLLLERAGNIIVGESCDGLQALNMLRQLAPGPDIVIVDLDIPGVGGIKLMEKLRHANYQGGLLVLTGRTAEHYMSRCENAGADAFISKKNSLEALTDAVRAIDRGYGYFPLKRALPAATALSAAQSEAIGLLSNRELEVLHYLIGGSRLVEISQKMYVSTKTVSTYKRRLLSKLGVKSTVELAALARLNDLVDE
ncbi:response regulator [Enterobacter mori]|uniref:response regulator n=1 Tax=Enterobacter mori TaxID=539813 RepID=UPI002B2161FA|nr:response regulator [Enterobacter mori]MEA5206353.1 response regulator [Enterobacter mori]